MGTYEKYFVYSIKVNSILKMATDGPKLSPTNVEGADGNDDASAGAAVGIVILFFVLYAVFIVYMAVSNKGLCRWTNGNGIGMYLLKSIANGFTFGILGIVMFFTYDECEGGAVRHVSRRQMMM